MFVLLVCIVVDDEVSEVLEEVILVFVVETVFEQPKDNEITIVNKDAKINLLMTRFTFNFFNSLYIPENSQISLFFMQLELLI